MQYVKTISEKARIALSDATDTLTNIQHICLQQDIQSQWSCIKHFSQDHLLWWSHFHMTVFQLVTFIITNVSFNKTNPTSKSITNTQSSFRFHIMIVEGFIRPASIQTSDRKRNQSVGYFFFFSIGLFWAALMWVCCFGHTSPKQVELHLPRPADDRRHRRCENRPLIQCAISLMDNLSVERWWIRLQYFRPASILFVRVWSSSPLEHTSLRCCLNMSKQDGWLRTREC